MVHEARRREGSKLSAPAHVPPPASTATPNLHPDLAVYTAECLARQKLHESVVKAERVPTPSFHLTHVPVEALSLVAEWLPGTSVAHLWFTGDKALQRKLQRAVRRIEVTLEFLTGCANRLSVPLLSQLTALETVIFSPRTPKSFEGRVTILDLSVVPKSLKHLQIRIPITIRTFTKSPTGRADFFDWKELMPDLRFFDISETSVGLYEDMAPWMPQYLRTLRFASVGKIDQEFIDALPFLNLEEFCIHSESSYPPPSTPNSITLPKELLRLTWTYPWIYLAALPPQLQELVLTSPCMPNPYANTIEENNVIHKHPLWIRAFALSDLKRLELHANDYTPVMHGRTTSFLLDPYGVFSTLPQRLTCLIINFTPPLDTIDRLATTDCISHLPATLLELTLAGFDVPLAHLESLPCDNLRRLSIFEQGQPSHHSKPGKKVVAGDFYRIARRVPRGGSHLVSPNDPRYSPYGLIEGQYLAAAPSPEEPNIGDEERQRRIDRLNAITKFSPALVNSLPRSLVALHIPHAHLHALEYLGPHTWPAALGELHVGEIPTSYIPQLPQSLYLLDCLFSPPNFNHPRTRDEEDDYEENQDSGNASSAPHESDASSADFSEHVVTDDKPSSSASAMGESVQGSLLPPLLHRLRCSVPHSLFLTSAIRLPPKLANLDIAVQDKDRHPMLPEDWSTVFPPSLHSLAIAGVSDLFTDAWFDHLPLATLRELEIDLTGPCRLYSLNVLPPLLSRFTLRTTADLSFEHKETLPDTLELLDIQAPAGNFRSKVWLRRRSSFSAPSLEEEN